MTVSTWLSDRGLLDSFVGLGQLTRLVARTVSAVNIDRYAELVMDKYLRRRLIAAGLEIAGLGADTTQSLEAVFDQSESRLFNVSTSRLNASTKPNSEVAAAAYNSLENHTPIYATGLYDLDQLLFGFEPGTLTILAGRPSMGKTYVSIFLALQLLVKHRLPVVFFSLEMTAQQLEYRLWSLISVHPAYHSHQLRPLDSARLRLHRAGDETLSHSELENIVNVMGLAAELPLYLNDNRGINVNGIASECRRLLTEGKKLGLVVVDYLQMMASETGGNRSYELGDVARGLYKLAGELNVPILALSQISRAVEGRQNKRPTMADLSQSGILEMVADNVILAYRDDYYNPDTVDQEVLELIVGKARHGSTGTAKCLFNKAYGLLKSLA